MNKLLVVVTLGVSSLQAASLVQKPATVGAATARVVLLQAARRSTATQASETKVADAVKSQGATQEIADLKVRIEQLEKSVHKGEDKRQDMNFPTPVRLFLGVYVCLITVMMGTVTVDMLAGLASRLS